MAQLHESHVLGPDARENGSKRGTGHGAAPAQHIPWQEVSEHKP